MDQPQPQPKQEKPKRFQGLCDLSKRTFDFSSLCCWNNCPRKFYWNYVKGYKWSALAADFGSAFHKAIELREDGKDIAEAMDYIPPEESGKYSRARLETILNGYFEKYKDDIMKVRRNEVEFTLPLENGCFYSGKIDRIVERQERVYVLDTKTTGSLGQYFFQKYAYPHMQMDGYSWATLQLVGKCDGVIVDGISTAERPQSDRYQRAEFYRTPEQLAEFEETVVQLTFEVEDTLLCAKAAVDPKKQFLMRTTWCEQYGGCLYRDLCAYGESESTVAKFQPKEQE